MHSFTINGWRQYQRYTDRLPKWIAVYSTIRDDLDMKAMRAGESTITDEEIGQLLGIFCLATRLDRPDEMPSGPEIPMDAEWVQKKAGLDSPPNLKKLLSIGVISCNKMLQDDTVNCENLYLTGQDRTAEDKTKEPRAKPSFARETQEVLDYLREVTGKRYTNKTHIQACFKREGCTVEECKKVIDCKWREWKGTEFEKRVCASTPWLKSHFRDYLDEANNATAQALPEFPDPEDESWRDEIPEED